MAEDYTRELNPGYLAIVVATGLLSTFIAQLIPEEFSAVGALLVVMILVVGAVVYFSRLPAKRHAPLLAYLRFSLVALLVGALVALATGLLPRTSFDGVETPYWMTDALGIGSSNTFALQEVAYAGAITLVAVVAFWTSRRLLRPISFVAAAMAGAVLIHSAIPAIQVPLSTLDPVLTYVTWGALGVGIVLVNALIPVGLAEAKSFFSRSSKV